MTTARRTLRRSPRRRDRRGRGLRGLMYPATTPASRTRAERFDALVLEALEPIELRWGSELAELDLADLLHEVLVEQVAEYLNIEPDAVDGGEGQ